MPNIMITSRCNLSCSYCFANKLVNQNDASDITIDDFNYAINFSTSNGPTNIGIIGGEPTLHPNFGLFLQSLIDNDKVNRITVYTNGIQLDQYISLLAHPKIFILFNCNTSPNINQFQYQKLVTHIDHFYSQSKQMTLGVNIFDNDVDYTYIFELAKQYHQLMIRISLVIPTIDICTKYSYHDYFLSKKDKLLQLIELAKQYKIQLSFDCDAPPLCEIKNFKNVIIPHTCRPNIDITQKLEAIRCFGTSHICKVNIKDFTDLNTLKQYFIKNIDECVNKDMPKKECYHCMEYRIFNCHGGCIKFKTKKLMENKNE